jgi:fructose-bisphosphate aldolase, class I
VKAFARHSPKRVDGMHVDGIQRERMANDAGFIAALDQSGGSTPRALAEYGISKSAYSNDAEMFGLMHAMRVRMVTSPSFGGDRILGAILFQGTMDRSIAGRESARYLWDKKRVVPFLKVDQGLAAERDGVQLMNPIAELDALLAHARSKGVFGTKMRSVIHVANAAGVAAVLDQQFQFAMQILAGGLVPIIEPEVDIDSPQKAEAEELLKQGIADRLSTLGDYQDVILKITLPSVDNLYDEVLNHPRVLRGAALSGGYSRKEACELLSRNRQLIASFSRALTEGLSINQSDKDFDSTLDASISEIYAASVHKNG